MMPLHPKPPLSLASFKSRLVLPFWYQLTQVVLEQRPLNRCCSSSSCGFTRVIGLRSTGKQRINMPQAANICFKYYSFKKIN